jgi:UDP-N-acetylmuramoylalanine--D-glutamate ligase
MIKTVNKTQKHQLVKNRMKSLSSFTSIGHRLEFVRSINEVKWINDSKSTDMESTAFSLENIQGPIVWIVGNNEGERNLDLINDLAKNKVVEIICYGNFETKIKYYFASLIKYTYKHDLSDAIELAFKNAKPDSCVLFSPACSSYLNYNNYNQRGDHFKEIVSQLD